MTDEQRRRSRDIESRAQPLFLELARIDDEIRHLQRKLSDALTERNKIETQLNALSDEKSLFWEDVFKSMED